MKLVGVLIIVLSAGSVGIRIAVSLRKHCRLIRQLLSALEVLKNEICCCANPLPQSFALAAVSSEGEIGRIFSAAAKEMDRRRWITPQAAMQQALQEEAEFMRDKDLSEILLSLMAELGKYDRRAQDRAMDRARERLEELLHRAEQEAKVRSKTYEVLGICAGLSVAILLV